MEASAALAHLLMVSAEVREAILVNAEGAVTAGDLPPARATLLADAGKALLERAAALRGELEVELVHVMLAGGDLYAACRDGRTAVAVTSPDSTRPLVGYDLRVALAGGGGTPA
jgi:hypothetical protein